MDPNHLFDVHNWLGPDGLDSVQGRLNVLLFVPAGVTVSLALRRPLATLLILALLSAGLEAFQAFPGSVAAPPATGRPTPWGR